MADDDDFGHLFEKNIITAYRNDKKSAEDRVTIRVRHLRDAYKQLSAAIVDETSFALLRASHFSNVRYYKRIMKEMNYMDDRGVLYLAVGNPQRKVAIGNQPSHYYDPEKTWTTKQTDQLLVCSQTLAPICLFTNVNTNVCNI